MCAFVYFYTNLCAIHSKNCVPHFWTPCLKMAPQKQEENKMRETFENLYKNNFTRQFFALYLIFQCSIWLNRCEFVFFFHFLPSTVSIKNNNSIKIVYVASIFIPSIVHREKKVHRDKVTAILTQPHREERKK